MAKMERETVVRFTFKGTILINGKFHEYRITLTASKEACDFIGNFLRIKLQQKGWMP